MKKVLLALAITCCTAMTLMAQISGTTSVTTGSSHTYSYTSGGMVFSPQWRLDLGYGTITSQWQSGSTYYATITWNSAGSETLAFLDNFNYLASANITITLALPPPPATSTATGISTTSFTANWSYVASATGYRLDVSTNSAFSSFVSGFNNLFVGTTGQSVTGLSAGTTYYYRVRSQNAAGASGNSNVTTTLTLPSAPAASAASALAATSFTASWGSVLSATGYRLDLSTVNTFASFVSGYNNLTVTGLTQSVTGLTAGTTYYYRVRAVNAAGISASSSAITVLTLPSAPSANAATGITETSFTASWGSVLSATGYRLDVSTVNTFASFVSGYSNLTVTGLTQSVSGLTAGTTYYFRVRAVNASGASANSSIITAVTAQPDYNYIRTTTVLKQGVTTQTQIDSALIGQKMVTTDFFDGIGRQSQSVSMRASPGLNDIVQPAVYDQYGRETVKYLPYTSGSSGSFKVDFLRREDASYPNSPQYQFYQSTAKVASDPRPFSETIFEASPLNRPDKEYGVGQAWAAVAGGADKFIQHGYLINVHNTGISATQEKVIAWNVSTGNLPVRVVPAAGYVVTGGYYASSQLSIKSTRDEQGNEVREYTDKLGRVILKKVQAAASSDLNNLTQWALTYYVYDDLGNLRFVLPPELSKIIHTNADTYLVSTVDLNNWAFQYTFDGRKRMITKQVPGAGAVYMIYDNRDRLVLTQDALQRSASPFRWTFTKYDELNRPILTGIKDTTASLTQDQMQIVVNTYYDPTKTWRQYGETYVSNATGNVHGYSNKAYPVRTTGSTADANSYLTVTYYDNYTFRSDWPGSYLYTSDSLTATSSTGNYSQMATGTENVRVTGQVTGSKIKVLDGGTTGGYTWLKSISYYDNNYLVVQTQADNYKGGIDRISNVYDFAGKVIKTKTTHQEKDIAWKDMVGATQIGNRLIRTAATSNWTGSGAVSVQQLAAGQNGWMEVTVSETTTNRMIGLASTNPDLNYTSINYAFYLNTNSLKVYENNIAKFTATGALVPGEVLRIERSGTSIQYKRNGTVIYTSANASSSLLMVDASLNTYNASLLSSSSLVGVKASFGATTKKTTRRFEYDHAGRLLKTWHQLEDTGSEFLLTLNEYNELGQLVDKKLHSTVSNASDARQSVDYRYNIRGWLTKMNESNVSTLAPDDVVKDYFGFELAYNNTNLGIGNTAQYNGNISAMAWSNNQSLGTNKQNGFIYSYDPMNRLTLGTHKLSATTGTWTAGQYEESISSYDLNGNIKALQRKGDGGLQIDNLTYNYGAGATLSNKLLYVQDNTVNTADKAKGFVDGNTGTAQDYSYDVNGNMNRDLNKGIGTTISDATNLITYNLLNLPETVTKGTNSIRYIYDATGRKLAQVTTFGGQQKTVDYSGEFQYENDVLQIISHEEGRMAMTGTKSIYLHTGDAVSGITAATSTLATVNGTNGEKYISATSVGTTAKQGMFPIGSSINVQGGEQYRIRAKGYRTGANSVHIYLKLNETTELNWPGSQLANGSVSEAWVEQIVTIPGTLPATLKAGVVWNTVTAGQQFFLNDFEITRLTTNPTPEYQYNLKDHLGNVRLTFTTKDETINETATLEDANLNVEQSQFLRIANAKRINATIFDRTNGSSTGYSERLNGSTNEKYGIAKSISVMPGDVINAEVHAKYADTNSANWTGALSTLMSQIAASTAGVVVDGASYSTSTSSFPAGFGTLQSTNNNGAPRAYLNWLIFDRNYGYLTGGFKQITTAARETGTDVAHERIFNTSPIQITQPGYVYIYLSNESTSLVEVFFDDFKVTHTKSPVIQTDDYYPFGLTFNSYQRENGVTNRWKFQEQEHVDDLSLNWDSFKWRNHQPDIGRFFNIDPLAEKYAYNSPYAFSENRVIDGRELEGLEWESIKTDAGTTRQLTVQLYNNSSLKSDQVTKLTETLKTNFAKSYGGEGSIAQLVINHVSEAKGDFLVTLIDTKSTSVYDKDSKEITGKTFTGGKTGNLGQTKKNSFEVSATVDGVKRGDSDLSRSFSHEAGHTGGLQHPWEASNKVTDIKQGSEGVKNSTVKSNLMNSDQNPTLSNRSTSGTSTTSGQLKSLDDLIKRQSGK